MKILKFFQSSAAAQPIGLHLYAPQYLVLTKLVKCLLSFSHGHSDVERGFSQNNNLISDDRSLLNESSINGLRATNGDIQFFGDGKTHLVSIPLVCSKSCHSVF